MYWLAWALVVVIGIVICLAMWLPAMALMNRFGQHAVGVFAMMIGALGIAGAFVQLGGGHIQQALLVSGAIVLGCGSIAAAIGKTRE